MVINYKKTKGYSSEEQSSNNLQLSNKYGNIGNTKLAERIDRCTQLHNDYYSSGIITNKPFYRCHNKFCAYCSAQYQRKVFAVVRGGVKLIDQYAFTPYFVTLTVSDFSIDENLQQKIDLVDKAFGNYKRSRQSSKYIIGYFAAKEFSINSLSETINYHYHCIFFTIPDKNGQNITIDTIYECWRNACRKVSPVENIFRGVDLKLLDSNDKGIAYNIANTASYSIKQVKEVYDLDDEKFKILDSLLSNKRRHSRGGILAKAIAKATSWCPSPV